MSARPPARQRTGLRWFTPLIDPNRSDGSSFKVDEIIRDAIKLKRIPELGWATKADDSAFTGAANRADVSGSKARNARNSGPAPTRTMTLAQARSFVSDLVAKWLDSLAVSQPLNLRTRGRPLTHHATGPGQGWKSEPASPNVRLVVPNHLKRRYVQ
jgi:hypothetical protein